MSLQYVDKRTSSLTKSAVDSSQVLTEGELVVQNSDNTISRLDPATDTLPNGIIVHDPRGDSIVEHDEDYVAYEDLWKYDGSEGDEAYWQPLGDVDRIMPRSITDTTDSNGNTPPEPSFGKGNTLGIMIGPSGETRVVPSGYTYDVDDDGTVETFSESGDGDFIAIGRMHQYPQELRITDAYDERVNIRLDSDVFSP